MSITRLEFNRTFTSVMAQEFSHIPKENKIEYVFSPSFERKKQKLLNSVKHSAWYWVNTVGKRVAVITLILLILFSAAMQVDAVRKPVKDFFTETFKGFVRINYEGPVTKEITYEYDFSVLPEGYERLHRSCNPAAVITIIRHRNGETITLDQVITSGDNFEIDNEHGVITYPMVGDIKVLAWCMEQQKFLIWYYEGYNFVLSHYGSMPLEELLEIIPTIQ